MCPGHPASEGGGGCFMHYLFGMPLIQRHTGHGPRRMFCHPPIIPGHPVQLLATPETHVHGEFVHLLSHCRKPGIVQGRCRSTPLAAKLVGDLYKSLHRVLQGNPVVCTSFVGQQKDTVAVHDQCTWLGLQDRGWNDQASGPKFETAPAADLFLHAQLECGVALQRANILHPGGLVPSA